MATEVLVTAGGTIAPVDDVRALRNSSTGRFAARIAEALARRGATVHYLHAPDALRPFHRLAAFDLDAPDPDAEVERLRQLRRDWVAFRERIRFHPLATGTVTEYDRAILALGDQHRFDAAFLAMAASDYAPEPVRGKIGSDAATLAIVCHRQPKVIERFRSRFPQTFLVGFKLMSRVPTETLISTAEAAARTHGADLTVANDLATVQAGRHAVHLVASGQPVESIAPPDDIAARLVDRVLRSLEARG